MASFVEEFFRALREQRIAHCVSRNYDSFPYPESETSDLDVLIEGERWPDVLSALQSTISRQGLARLGSYTDTSGTMLVSFIAGPAGPVLHLDLQSRLIWSLYDLVDVDLVLENTIQDRTPPRPRPGHEAAILLLPYLFHRGVVKSAYRSRIVQLARTDGAAFRSTIEEIWGTRASAALCELIASEDWSGIVTWRESAAASLKRKAWWSKPRKTALRGLARIRNQVTRLRNPPGLSIAILGPDGCGKSTVHEGLATVLASRFPPEKVRKFHWRPGLLPAPATLLNRRADELESGNPHARNPHGLPLSLLRFLYFTLDFILGSLLIVRPSLSRNALVLMDRYFYDLFVDQRRYRLKLPTWLLSLAGKAIPRPDLVFYLDAPPEQILARKPELDADEITRQRAAFRQVVRALGPRAILVDASKPACELVLELRQYVFAYLRSRALQTGLPRTLGESSSTGLIP